LDSQERRVKTFAAFRDLLAALAERSPIVLVLEDLHWADTLSLELTAFLMESFASAAVLLVSVFRPERGHRCWRLAGLAERLFGDGYSEIWVRELDGEERVELVARILGNLDVGREIRMLVTDRAQGNPFYLEEVIRALIETGSLRSEQRRWVLAGSETNVLPETVQAVVLSRFSRLPEKHRAVLATASAFGRPFSRSALEVALDVPAIEQILWELEDRAFIRQERVLPDAEYAFRHVLAREAVYRSLADDQRRRIHGAVARAIERSSPGLQDERLEELAFHWHLSGELETAADYYQRAGERASARSADIEASSHLRKALDLFETFPGSQDVRIRRLRTRLALGHALVLSGGHASRDAETVYEAAFSDSEALGVLPERSIIPSTQSWLPT
jgi:predicted ATPase